MTEEKNSPAKELPGPPPKWTPVSTVTAGGMMAAEWSDEDDRILEQIRLDRKRDSRRKSTPRT